MAISFTFLPLPKLLPLPEDAKLIPLRRRVVEKIINFLEQRWRAVFECPWPKKITMEYNTVKPGSFTIHLPFLTFFGPFTGIPGEVMAQILADAEITEYHLSSMKTVEETNTRIIDVNGSFERGYGYPESYLKMLELEENEESKASLNISKSQESKVSGSDTSPSNIPNTSLPVAAHRPLSTPDPDISNRELEKMENKPLERVEEKKSQWQSSAISAPSEAPIAAHRPIPAPESSNQPEELIARLSVLTSLRDDVFLEPSARGNRDINLNALFGHKQLEGGEQKKNQAQPSSISAPSEPPVAAQQPIPVSSEYTDEHLKMLTEEFIQSQPARSNGLNPQRLQWIAPKQAPKQGRFKGHQIRCYTLPSDSKEAQKFSENFHRFLSSKRYDVRILSAKNSKRPSITVDLTASQNNKGVSR